MSPSLSAHLLEQYHAIRAASAPFGQSLSSSQQLAVSGPMSYAPNMHGSLQRQPSFFDQSASNMSAGDVSINSLYADISQSTAQKIATLQAKLDKKLGPEYISQRPGPGGAMRLTYAEGWKIINLANEVFGFNGWSSSIVNLNTDFIDFDEGSRRYSVGVSAVIRVTLRDGVYHEDVGYGMLENSKSKGAALDKCKKEAVTDGVKRALRNFGNLLGNCLYDKEYTQEIVKMKVPPRKFDTSSLHRRPEYQEGNSTTSERPSNSGSSAGAPPSKPPVPRVIPKAIGVNSNSNRQSSNVSTSVASKPPGPNAVPGLPVATSTPLRNATAQGGPQTRKDENGTASGRPQAPTTATSNRASSSSSMQAGRAPNHTPKEIGSAAQPAKPKPRPLQDLERVDTYSFDSEYDADFLAELEQAEGDAVLNDLEADMGRPIDDCEGVGRAIDFEEGGTGTRTYGTTDITISPSTSGDERTLVEQSGDANMSRWKVPEQNVGKPAQPALKTTDLKVPCRQVPPARFGGVAQPREHPKAMAAPAPAQMSSAEDEIAKQIIAMRQQRKAAASNAPASGTVADENTRPKVVMNPPQPPPSSKPRTPSMGGFNFPPGMKPGAAPLSSGVRQSQPVNVKAGVKRSADSMNSTTSDGPVSYAKVQATAQACSARQPFARLDDLDGGDLKRIRR